MGRQPATGPRVYFKRDWAYAYFVWEGVEYRPALGTRDRVEAQKRAARAYAQAVNGQLQQPRRRVAGVGLDLAELLDRWIEFKRPTIDATFVPTLECYARRYVDYFVSVDRMTEGTAQDFCHARLGQALRTTVLRERAYLVQFLEWCQLHGVIGQVPRIRPLPKKAPGKRTGTQRAKSVATTQAERRAILALVPEQSKTIGGRKWPIRALYAVQFETAFRPATLAKLRTPDNWRPGWAHVELTDRDDKARWGRTVDISAEAAALLKRVAPAEGLIFGRHVFYKAIKRAARAVLGEERGRRFAPYDFRHGRAKDWLDAGAKIRGVSYQLGHKRPSTTDKYLAPDRQAGAEALRAGKKKR
jgi:integrase